MRKFLWGVALGVLVLAMAAPAMALDFKFGGEYRVRFYSYDNSASQVNTFDHNNPNRNLRGIQLRVRPMFSVSDDNGNIQAVWRAEIGDIEWGNGGGAHSVDNGVNSTPGTARVGNGAGGSLGDDGVNVETKWAYIDFATPFNIPLRWRVGEQAWYLPKGILVDDDAVGVRAYGKSGIVSYEASWFRISAGPNANASPPAGIAGISNSVGGVGISGTGTQATDNNFDMYMLRTDLAIAKWLNPGVYFLYGLNKAVANDPTPAQLYFIGLTATGQAGNVSYDFDFVYGSAEGGPNGTVHDPASGKFVKNNGLVFDAGVHFPIGPMVLNLVGSYATGDKGNGGTSEAMPYISPSWNGAGGQYEVFGSGGTFDVTDTQDYPANSWMLGATLEYRPVKPLWLRVSYGFVGLVNVHGNCAVGNTSGIACIGPSYNKLAAAGVGAATGNKNAPWLGQDIEFRADYTMWTGFQVQAMAGWLIPYEGNPAQKLILQLLYTF